MADEIRFDWDDTNINHIARHNVTPNEAEQVLTNEPVDLDIQFINNEERYVVIGLTNKGRFLILVWTERAGLFRVVTAFSAGAAEQQEYWKVKGS